MPSQTNDTGETVLGAFLTLAVIGGLSYIGYKIMKDVQHYKKHPEADPVHPALPARPPDKMTRREQDAWCGIVNGEWDYAEWLRGMYINEEDS